MRFLRKSAIFLEWLPLFFLRQCSMPSCNKGKANCVEQNNAKNLEKMLDF